VTRHDAAGHMVTTIIEAVQRFKAGATLAIP
jgi:hypothetical protein